MSPEPNAPRMSMTPRRRALLFVLLLAMTLLFTALASATCGPRHYRVHAGDTLSSIAAQFGTSVAALAAANNLDPQAVLPIGLELLYRESSHSRSPRCSGSARAFARRPMSSEWAGPAVRHGKETWS
jgi:LysM domain